MGLGSEAQKAGTRKAGSTGLSRCARTKGPVSTKS
ncbi:hypothetical protein LINGRAPRIM_LOCUS449 [Linum grandiflorum]